jgi:hypothetical protein
MSNLSPENRPPADPGAPNPPAFNRSTALTVVMILAGIVLLLPGLCTMFFAFILFDMDGWRGFRDIEVWFIAIPCFAISALGIWLLVRVIRKR